MRAVNEFATYLRKRRLVAISMFAEGYFRIDDLAKDSVGWELQVWA
jgi:hypothetical protein